jgi:hypothetical protein
MKHYCHLLLILLCQFANGQAVIPPYGEVSIEDLKLRSCHFEPDATAMRLFDVTETDVDVTPLRINTQRRVRIKIFNEKGYEHASIKVPFYNSKKSKIKDLVGVVYNLDSTGKIVVQHLEEDDFFKEKDGKIGIINFTFPNLKPGSIIEYKYSKSEKNIPVIEPWFPQQNIPTAYSSVTIVTSVDSETRELSTGQDSVHYKFERLGKTPPTRGKKQFFCYDLPSFQSEPFMSSFNDNLLKVVFLLIPKSLGFIDFARAPNTLWKLMGTSILQSDAFDFQIRKVHPGTEKLIDSAKKIPVIADRIGFIYHRVQQLFPHTTENSLFSGDLSDVWNERTGNTAEINLVLLNLLRQSGIKAYALLVSTRENGKVNINFPGGGQLNGIDIIAYDSSRTFIMDATLRYQPHTIPPQNILNRDAYLLDEKEMKWITITDDRFLLKQNSNIQAAVGNDGKITGTAYTWHYDFAKSYLLDSALEKEDDKFFDKKPQGLTIHSLKQENTQNNSSPLLQTIDFLYEPQQTGDYLFINPQLFSAKKANPFTKDFRRTDIDLGCKQSFSLKFSLQVPEGFTIDHLPKNIVVRADDSSFYYRRSCESDGNGLYLMETFEILKPIFGKDDYTSMQEFFKRAYALMTEEIVLKVKK